MVPEQAGKMAQAGEDGSRETRPQRVPSSGKHEVTSHRYALLRVPFAIVDRWSLNFQWKLMVFLAETWPVRHWVYRGILGSLLRAC